MFENFSQIAFIAAFFETYDENLHSYKTNFNASEETFAIMISSTFDSEFSESFNVMFLFFEIFELQFSEKFKRMKILTEKNNESNKKVHINSNVSFAQLKEQISHFKHNFQSRSKKKSLKKIKKTVDFFSLIDMMNEITDMFNKSVFIK